LLCVCAVIGVVVAAGAAVVAVAVAAAVVGVVVAAGVVDIYIYNTLYISYCSCNGSRPPPVYMWFPCAG